MQSCVLVVMTVAIAAVTAGEHEEPLRFYHEAVGIPEAARIRQRERGGSNRVAGGESAKPGDQPHLGGLLIELFDGRRSVCGCSMLSNTRAVTAAHCWSDGQRFARRFTVVYGSTRLYRGGTRVTTDDVQVHEEWNPSNLRNDIAIISHEFVGYTNTVNRIRLPSDSQRNDDFAGQTATAAGYGRTGENAGITSEQDPRRVDLLVIRNAECAAVYGSGTVAASTLCARGDGGRGVCAGDSGGPLSVGLGDDRILIGVASFASSSGCQRGRPAGFARVTFFLPWIQQRL